MDGNRRWARENGLPAFEGHKKGYEKIKEVSAWAEGAGVTHLIFYMFSTENWNRTKEEVGYLMDLFRFVLREELKYCKKQNIKVIVIGKKESLPDDIQKDIIRAEKETEDSHGLNLVAVISYGGRSEIVSAIQAIIKEGTSGKEIGEEEIQNHLWTKNIPDPDIIIRTGGEKRLSNFLPWQSVYSELFFIDTYWPDFSKKDFEEILKEFASRERRHGR